MLCFSMASEGYMSCQDILGPLAVRNSVNFSIFTGYPRDSDFVSEHLEYPSNWSYRQLGGEHGQLEGEVLKGATAETYLATKPDGSKIVLKAYSELSTLERDLSSYQDLDAMTPHSKYGFIVPNVTHSERNSFVLEIEYFEGVNLTDFLRSNENLRTSLIKDYNLNVTILEKHHSMTPYDVSELSVDGSAMKEFVVSEGDDDVIALSPDNTLVIKDPKDPKKFRLVIIDPE